MYVSEINNYLDKYHTESQYDIRYNKLQLFDPA